MNTQTHRLIFNPTRGCLMAVAGTGRSSGKSSACGTTRSAHTQSPRCSRRTEHQASNRPIAPGYIARAATNSIAYIALQGPDVNLNLNLGASSSSIQAGNTVTLDAHSKLNLVSTQSTTQDTSSNSSSSGSVGVGYSSSVGLNVNASASESSGRGNGNSVIQNNTLIQGKQIALKSGADTTVAGAVVSACQCRS